MIITGLKEHHRIIRADIMESCTLSIGQAARLISMMVKKHPEIQRKGAVKSTYYIWGEE